MTRLEAAVAELVDALRAEVASRNEAPAQPERLLDVDEARQALGGIARSTLYELIERGELRTLTIGRRRVVPSSAIAEMAAKAR
ncbi:MAG TPA: helix-turn-helix domain-containing protein [Candidatus Dormibacteraeota bacterium]|nr:helix-turn-helix domain-containing protein [Candidatus Dormibacteraeota bacterium]